MKQVKTWTDVSLEKVCRRQTCVWRGVQHHQPWFLLCLTLWPYGLQNARLLCPLLSPGICSNSCPLSRWPSHSLLPLLLLPLIFPSIRVFSNELALCIRWPKNGASASVLSMNIQDWFPLGLTGLISLLSKGLSRVFSALHFKSVNFSVLRHLYDATLTSTHDCWKIHSFD